MRYLSFVLILFLSLPLMARKPAVEDFVGIEVPMPEVPPGVEPLYNFSQDITHFEDSRFTNNKDLLSPQSIPEAKSEFKLNFKYIGISFILMLPLMILGILQYKLRLNQRSVENNVIELSQYRKKKNNDDSKAA